PELAERLCRGGRRALGDRRPLGPVALAVPVGPTDLVRAAPARPGPPAPRRPRPVRSRLVGRPHRRRLGTPPRPGPSRPRTARPAFVPPPEGAGLEGPGARRARGPDRRGRDPRGPRRAPTGRRRRGRARRRRLPALVCEARRAG